MSRPGVGRRPWSAIASDGPACERQCYFFSAESWLFSFLIFGAITTEQ